MKTALFGIFTLIAVLVFTFTLAFVWTGSAGVEYERVAMTGDRSTAEVMAEIEDRYKKKTEEYNEDEMDIGAGDRALEQGGGGPRTVVWISIPGFRGDYVENAAAAFMSKMVEEGTSTTKMRPNFPPVDYSAHMTLATGAHPKTHGIPSDSFKVNGSIVNKPTDPSLAMAEPIWETATRQGIATLVHDWPLSQNQTGANKAAYFLNSYDPEESDEQRLEKLWQAWSSHKGESKLRLMMIRLDDILRAGMMNGSRAEETYEVVKATDTLLEGFVGKVQAAWPNLRSSANDNLVILITTPHGLVDLDKNVNLGQLLGAELMENIDAATHDGVGQLYFKNLPESVAEANLRKDQIDAELKKRIYFRTYKQDDLPSDWHYTGADGRIGDRVLVLKEGFAFSDMTAEEPVFDPSDGPGFYAGYGYPWEDSIRMSGQVIAWGYPQQVGYGDLGEIDQTGFHAAVAEMLGIKRSEKASDKPVSIR